MAQKRERPRLADAASRFIHFDTEFQLALKRNCIKFRPVKPRSPHLNGKVERSQMTDKIEFSLADVDRIRDER